MGSSSTVRHHRDRCIGDGHDEIWNIIKELAPLQQRWEIQGLAIINAENMTQSR